MVGWTEAAILVQASRGGSTRCFLLREYKEVDRPYFLGQAVTRCLDPHEFILEMSYSMKFEKYEKQFYDSLSVVMTHLDLLEDLLFLQNNFQKHIEALTAWHAWSQNKLSCLLTISCISRQSFDELRATDGN